MADTVSRRPGARPAWPYADFAEAAAGQAARRELWGWAALAVASLALAGLFALFLALSRLPGVEDVFPWPLGFFHKGLVVHVVFSFVVWFLAVLGALLHLAALRVSAGAPRLAVLGRAGLLMATAASVLLFVPALLDRGEATLNDYLPAIIDPLFYQGLALLAAGLALAVLRLLVNLPDRARPLDPVSLAASAAGIIYLVAVACFAAAWWRLAGEAPSFAFNENLFWGGGHVLQFVNAAMLLAAWYLLTGLSLGRPLVGPRLFAAAAALLMLGALAGPAVYVAFEDFTAAQADAFTNLQYALAVPVALVAGAGAASLRRHRRDGGAWPWAEPAFLCLALSVLVFGVGGFLGLFVDGADTRTPAHYHGVIGGITIAFMGVFFALFLPLLERPVKRGRLVHAQVGLYGLGQVMAALGLFWAGGYGVPRKTAGAGQGLDDFGAVAGMALNGLGALIAVIGGVLFIWTAAAALLGKPRPAK